MIRILTPINLIQSVHNNKPKKQEQKPSFDEYLFRAMVNERDKQK